MATAPSPNDLTRQQLDELDALLQRMLSVPLAPPDTPLPAALPGRGASDRAAELPLPPSWRVDPPSPVAGASQPHIALPDPPSAVSLKFEAPPPAPRSAAPLPVPKPAAKVPPPAAPAPKPVVSARKPVAPAPRSAAPPVPLPLLPLVALNALFDGICGMFGPPGRLLRSGFFKHLYGLAGLGLIAYTAAHVAQAQGWVTLPVALPWPR